MLVEQVVSRLQYLDAVGVGHLALERPLRTLSGGEAQRVALTSALGSNLVGMLYVLDEPSVGLASGRRAAAGRRDSRAARPRQHGGGGRARGAVLQAADHVVEMGPGAGEFGGKVVFQGTPAEMVESRESRTGDWLAGRRTLGRRAARRRAANTAGFAWSAPRATTCRISRRVSARRAVPGDRRERRGQEHARAADAVSRGRRSGCGRKSSGPSHSATFWACSRSKTCVLIDQSPIGRTPRSNPVTYVKAFDPIRALFAESNEAQARGFKAGHFSFNVEGGRCEACQGDGFMQIDMRFMADVYMKCPECHGKRYRREVLDVKYRGYNIAEVLDLSVREAFTFFRGHRKILARLKCLIDVGLDYLRLGQPANTLSGGESQRLKLATYISAERRGRTLFVLDEPTTGLALFRCAATGRLLRFAGRYGALAGRGRAQSADHAGGGLDHRSGPRRGGRGGPRRRRGHTGANRGNSASITGKFLSKELKKTAKALAAG